MFRVSPVHHQGVQLYEHTVGRTINLLLILQNSFMFRTSVVHKEVVQLYKTIGSQYYHLQYKELW